MAGPIRSRESANSLVDPGGLPGDWEEPDRIGDRWRQYLIHQASGRRGQYQPERPEHKPCDVRARHSSEPGLVQPAYIASAGPQRQVLTRQSAAKAAAP